MTTEVNSGDMMQELGARIGALLHGGEVIELVGDVGAGKTTFTKGLAKGLGIDEDIQSPTFTISRVYEARDELTLAHYDFYRLVDAGIMSAELYEAVHDPGTVTVIEWGDVVAGVLPKDRISLAITATGEEQRLVAINGQGERSIKIVEQLT
jgi:tRNA threonylcarbamoyladenosine biosynthesis protein TsaE